MQEAQHRFSSELKLAWCSFFLRASFIQKSEQLDSVAIYLCVSWVRLNYFLRRSESKGEISSDFTRR